MKRFDKEGLAARVEGYIAAVSASAAADFAKNFSCLKPPKFESELGVRYIKIVKVDAPGASRSVHSFIERSSGDILKAASWRAPAKHARGNVFEEDFGMKSSGANWIGVRYL